MIWAFISFEVEQEQRSNLWEIMHKNFRAILHVSLSCVLQPRSQLILVCIIPKSASQPPIPFLFETKNQDGVFCLSYFDEQQSICNRSNKSDQNQRTRKCKKSIGNVISSLEVLRSNWKPEKAYRNVYLFVRTAKISVG